MDWLLVTLIKLTIKTIKIVAVNTAYFNMQTSQSKTYDYTVTGKCTNVLIQDGVLQCCLLC